MSVRTFEWLDEGDTFFAVNAAYQREGPMLKKLDGGRAKIAANHSILEFKPDAKVFPTRDTERKHERAKS